jgi:hypothetical protein
MPMQTDYSDAPAKAVAGQIACNLLDAEIISGYNAEASASIPFGRAVECASATDPRAMKLPDSETDKIVGFTCRSHSIQSGERGELDDAAGVKVGGQLNVMTDGVIWVVVHSGCAPYQKLWVRAVGGGANELLGGAENADDGTDTIDCTGQGRFVSYAAADGLAKLAIDFTNA